MEWKRKAINLAIGAGVVVALLFFAASAVLACDEADALLKLWQNFDGSQSFGVTNDMNVINVNVGGNQGAKLQIGAKGYNNSVGVTGKLDQQTEWSQGWSVLEEEWKAGQNTRLTTNQSLKVWGEIKAKDPKLTAAQGLTGSLTGSFGIQDGQAVMNATGTQTGQQQLEIWKNNIGTAGAILTQTGTTAITQWWVTPNTYQYMGAEGNVSMKTWGVVR